MRSHVFLLVLLTLCGTNLRAGTPAPAAEKTGGCVSASVEVVADGAAQALYRIAFVNRCAGPRTLYWCADSPGAAVPPALVCPRGRGFALEPRHAILYRKEFQWHLPRGSRIRYHDCPGQDLPTADFGCAAP